MTVYLDTSALVKLYIEEEGSAEVHAWVDEADMAATSVAAYAEARAAFAAMARRGRGQPGKLSRATLHAAVAALDDDWPHVAVLTVTSALARHAGELAERYGLRGYDSIHLASYCEVVRRNPDPPPRFACFDHDLSAAAALWLRQVAAPAGAPAARRR